MKKVLMSLLVAITVLGLTTTAFAERMDVTLYSGNISATSNYVYVDAGNTLHVGVDLITLGGNYLGFIVHDNNGKEITKGTIINPSDDRAYAVGVPVGYYKLTLTCATQEVPGCSAKGWIND